jgi:NADH:ubiquinone oxidoreductase subunit 5 (subunit L)/multisubunit Na+/H+ antiporter MnhA subunit
LINFWFIRIQANKAAIKAMVLNRVGDFSLLIAIFLILISFKSIDYNTVEALIPFFKISVVNMLFLKINSLEIIGFFMFIGAIGKSAQIGLHT